ncbi:TetR/AcrR family transcriptional regulator [Ilumatobacter nonamiensis]|uniref:TetR/AcrR family transcriptional regulator n=1 Tax=Ilumatobacter nonamiensis TaxID=467093 RepID=UPI00034AB195|nr:TetR/AcrR family transcriptional regulator [Ilumatobacter nonamiensis]
MSDTPSPRAARSRERLLRAATDLLVESGPRGVTVDAVAEASGVAKSTLYRQWSSRDDMLIDVVRCNIPALTQPNLTDGFESALRWYVNDGAATLADPEWSRIIPAMMSLQVTMPAVAACIEIDRTSKTATLRTIVDLGIEEGILPADIDVEMASRILFGPLVYSSLLGDQDQLDKLAVEVVDRFLAPYAV